MDTLETRFVAIGNTPGPVTNYHLGFGRQRLGQPAEKDVFVWFEPFIRKRHIRRKYTFLNIFLIDQRPGNHTQFNGLSFGIPAGGPPEWRLEMLKSRIACLFDQLRLRKYLVQINFKRCLYFRINQDIPESCNGLKEAVVTPVSPIHPKNRKQLFSIIDGATAFNDRQQYLLNQGIRVSFSKGKNV